MSAASITVSGSEILINMFNSQHLIINEHGRNDVLQARSE